MRLVTAVIIWWLWQPAGSLPQSSPLKTAVKALVVFDLQLTADRPAVTFRLQNTTSKTITAWRVTVDVGGEQSGYGADAYPSFAGLSKVANHIVPGGSISVTAPLPSGLSASSLQPRVIPSAVVFDDRSSEGDKEYIDFVFAHRAIQLVQWREIVAEFDAVSRPASATLASMEHLLARLQSAPAGEKPNMVRRTAIMNLSWRVKSVSEGRATAQASVAALLEVARQNVAALSIHSR